jgi:hypothetical protein
MRAPGDEPGAFLLAALVVNPYCRRLILISHARFRWNQYTRIPPPDRFLFGGTVPAFHLTPFAFWNKSPVPFIVAAGIMEDHTGATAKRTGQ